MYIRDLKKLKQDIEQKELQLASLAAEIAKDKLNLQETCHHPQQYVKIEERYWEGSYLDRATTDRTPVCTICGAKGETKTVTHSWYG